MFFANDLKPHIPVSIFDGRGFGVKRIFGAPDHAAQSRICSGIESVRPMALHAIGLGLYHGHTVTGLGRLSTLFFDFFCDLVAIKKRYAFPRSAAIVVLALVRIFAKRGHGQAFIVTDVNAADISD